MYFQEIVFTIYDPHGKGLKCRRSTPPSMRQPARFIIVILAFIIMIMRERVASPDSRRVALPLVGPLRAPVECGAVATEPREFTHR